MRILRATQWSTAHIVAEVAACVRSGGTVVFPTETVYGIGCAPEDPKAIDAIYAAKSRSAGKPLALHVTDLAQASPFVGDINACARAAVECFWPGPVAIIVARNPQRFERAACALPTISLRCPSDELCRALLAATGPLAASSANRSGAGAFAGLEEDESALPDATIAVLAGPTRLRQESTILDCTSDTPIVVREGAVRGAQIAAALGTLRTLR